MAELVHDPRAFDYALTPAVVDLRSGDGHERTRSFANVRARDSGALQCRTWTDDTVLVPEWRWVEVRFIATERVDSATEIRQAVPADQRHHLPESVREALADQEATA